MLTHIFPHTDTEQRKDNIIDGCITIFLADCFQLGNFERFADRVIFLAFKFDLLRLYAVHICWPKEEEKERVSQG